MKLEKSKIIPDQSINIGGSKSISNRLLVLNRLFGNIFLMNLSNSEDTHLFEKALDSEDHVIDIHHAGTAMRFLTSYFAIQENREVVLTGSERMKQRPISALVDALRTLGADIEYEEKDGFPPLKIRGKKLCKSKVSIQSNISSQFITSLLLIGGKLENGLELHLLEDITSLPYLEMTLKILNELQIHTQTDGKVIKVYPFKESAISTKLRSYEVESDWSSASYFYSLSAISRENINLKSFYSHSLQGDSIVKQLYWDFFGVNTISDHGGHKISLLPDANFEFPEKIELDMNSCPDIVQTLCVTAVAFKIPFHITGLSTLKVKETDRLEALHVELKKIGCLTEITDESIQSIEFTEPESEIFIKTYNDHRMAMSFAPFCLLHSLEIENDNVVEKSYINFWEDFFSIVKPI